MSVSTGVRVTLGSILNVDLTKNEKNAVKMIRKYTIKEERIVEIAFCALEDGCYVARCLVLLKKTCRRNQLATFEKLATAIKKWNGIKRVCKGIRTHFATDDYTFSGLKINDYFLHSSERVSLPVDSVDFLQLATAATGAALRGETHATAEALLTPVKVAKDAVTRIRKELGLVSKTTTIYHDLEAGVQALDAGAKEKERLANLKEDWSGGKRGKGWKYERRVSWVNKLVNAEDEKIAKVKTTFEPSNLVYRLKEASQQSETILDAYAVAVDQMSPTVVRGQGVRVQLTEPELSLIRPKWDNFLENENFFLIPKSTFSVETELGGACVTLCQQAATRNPHEGESADQNRARVSEIRQYMNSEFDEQTPDYFLAGCEALQERSCEVLSSGCVEVIEHTFECGITGKLGLLWLAGSDSTVAGSFRRLLPWWIAKFESEYLAFVIPSCPLFKLRSYWGSIRGFEPFLGATIPQRFYNMTPWDVHRILELTHTRDATADPLIFINRKHPLYAQNHNQKHLDLIDGRITMGIALTSKPRRTHRTRRKGRKRRNSSEGARNTKLPKLPRV